MKQAVLDEGCPDLTAHCRCTHGLVCLQQRPRQELTKPGDFLGEIYEDWDRGNPVRIYIHCVSGKIRSPVGGRQIVALTRLIIGIRSHLPVML